VSRRSRVDALRALLRLLVDIFFPRTRTGSGRPDYTQARVICGNCIVRSQCLEHAMRYYERHGMWGGLTAPERDRAPQEAAPDSSSEARRVRIIAWDTLRLSFAPIDRVCHGMSHGDIAARLGVDLSQAAKWRARGLNVETADRLAVRLGYHPRELWGMAYDWAEDCTAELRARCKRGHRYDEHGVVRGNGARDCLVCERERKQRSRRRSEAA
jgi:hypothetical protein